MNNDSKTMIHASEVPRTYHLCSRKDCPKAHSCLHQIAYELTHETREILTIINPEFCDEADCKYYADANPQVFAKGFSKMQSRMYPAQYDEFMSRLRKLWGRTPYFERRRGERLLPDDEQALILQTLKDVGVTENLDFDDFVRGVKW